ncbi:hypothetical protein HYU93_01405 [Candidatus Daviesbacteria bacterium]|nr:hypothetical protein [Candidatus Daviesbacteria bacterium]
MPTTTQLNLFDSDAALMVSKGVILLILIFYAVFALIVVRQVDLMSKTLITKISPYVKAAAIVHAGFAIGLIILAWGIL